MWDSRPRLSGLVTAEGGCTTEEEKLLNIIFRGAQHGVAATKSSGDRAPSYNKAAYQHAVL